jgi:LPXTG-site transpeptidase (sortase) family protein
MESLKIRTIVHSIVAVLTGAGLAVTVYTFGIAVVSSAGTSVVHDRSTASVIEITQAPAASVRISPISALPSRLRIPSIKIDAHIEHLGLTQDGAVAVPEGPVDVSWFDRGPLPGQIGISVIVGHMGWLHNAPAVFDDLDKIRVGDKIFVEDENGVVAAFEVRSLRTYGEHEDDSDVFSSSDGKSHLNLITCGGVWVRSEQRYSERFVVFSDLII